MALANETLSKIERKNLIDFYDVEKQSQHSKLKSYSNFSITSAKDVFNR